MPMTSPVNSGRITVPRQRFLNHFLNHRLFWLQWEITLMKPYDVDTLEIKAQTELSTRAGVAFLADALDLGSCATVQLPFDHHANSVTEGFLMRCECFTNSSHLPCEYALDETFNETSPQTPTVAFFAVAAPDPRGPAVSLPVRGRHLVVPRPVQGQGCPGWPGPLHPAR